MTLSKIVLSHKSDEYITPESLYKTLNETFNFKLDPATTDDNPLRTEFFYTKENDGLTKSWPAVNTFINRRIRRLNFGLERRMTKLIANPTPS